MATSITISSGEGVPETGVVDIRRRLKPFLFLAAVLLTSFALYIATSPTVLTTLTTISDVDQVKANNSLAPNSNNSAVDQVRDYPLLDAILQNASMPNKTVILTTINSAWVQPGSVVDLFLESFRNGEGTSELLNHLILVCFDEQALLRCNAIHPHCYALKTEGVDFSVEEAFMSQGYLLMMWRRIDFLRTVLQKGYNFIFTDVDILWFRNPFPQFNDSIDFQIACDQYNGDPTSKSNRPNGGFDYVMANERSVAFYEFWYATRLKYPGQHDQDVLNIIKWDRNIQKLGLTMRFFSTKVFSGLCEPSMELDKVCTMHANCCVGLDKKINDLRVMLDDWKKYMSMSEDRKKARHWTWSFIRLLCT